MNIYDEVRTLMSIQAKSIKLYNMLKLVLMEESQNILYIFRNRVSKLEYLKYAKRYQKSINIKDDIVVYITNEIPVYLKTIDECKQLEGYRFKEIYFVD